MAYVRLNGVQFNNVKNVEPGVLKAGRTFVAKNGKRTRVQLGTARNFWTISWEHVDRATLEQVRTIAKLSGTFVFMDLDTTQYTVHCEDDAWEGGGVSLIAKGSGGASTTLYYSFSIKVYQAT